MTYLEIVALDPDGRRPGRARWFGLDDQKQLRRDWDAGRRLRGWVARTDDIDGVLKGREQIFGRKIALPMDAPSFDFTIPDDGALPPDDAPSIIDRRGKPRSMVTMADLDARLLASGSNILKPERWGRCSASLLSTGHPSPFPGPNYAMAPSSRRRVASGSFLELRTLGGEQI